MKKKSFKSILESLLSVTMLQEPSIRVTRGNTAIALAALAAAGAAGPGRAATLYWDLNGTPANVVVAETGAWNGTNPFWNTVANGTGGVPQAGTTAADDLVFSSATTGALYTTGTITASGTRAASSLTFSSNIVTTLAGAVTVGGNGTKSGVFSTVASNQTLSGVITLAANSTFQNTSTAALTFSGGVAGTGNLILNNNSTNGTGITISGALNLAGSVSVNSVNGANVHGAILVSGNIGAGSPASPSPATTNTPC